MNLSQLVVCERGLSFQSISNLKLQNWVCTNTAPVKKVWGVAFYTIKYYFSNYKELHKQPGGISQAVEWKKAGTKVYILHDSIYTKVQNRQKLGEIFVESNKRETFHCFLLWRERCPRGFWKKQALYLRGFCKSLSTCTFRIWYTFLYIF